MKKSELISQGSSKIRSDSTLLSFYIEIFKNEFGYKPACAGCTFLSDWNKLTNSNKKNIEIMSKSFEIKDRQKIYSFVKERRTNRCYGYNMTEEFAVDYLTIGTEEEIEIRKKDFKKLPVVEKETETEKGLSFKDLKELYPQFSEAKSKKEILVLIEESEDTKK